MSKETVLCMGGKVKHLLYIIKIDYQPRGKLATVKDWNTNVNFSKWLPLERRTVFI